MAIIWHIQRSRLVRLPACLFERVDFGHDGAFHFLLVVEHTIEVVWFMAAQNAHGEKRSVCRIVDGDLRREIH